jgi:hypothetical protein
MFPNMQPRKGFTMKVHGIHLNRPDLHNIAAELGVTTQDILYKNNILTVYNTTKSSQEIIDDNALLAFVAMALNIPTTDLSDLQEVEEKIVKMEFNLDDFDLD